jgi:hypothetical protein
MNIPDHQHEANINKRKELEAQGFKFTITADGYRVYHWSRFITGASVTLPRGKKLHWRHRDANLRDNLDIAIREAQKEQKKLRGQNPNKILTFHWTAAIEVPDAFDPKDVEDLREARDMAFRTLAPGDGELTNPQQVTGSIEEDLRLFGRAFTVDGVRVDPRKVYILSRGALVNPKKITY